MSAALDHLATRVMTDPLFLANALAEFAKSEQLDDAGLAAKLGCAVGDLTRLRLCGAPRAEQFRADVAAIATRFGIAPDTLASVVQRGQSLARLRAASPAETELSFMLAARDAERKSPPKTEGDP